MADGNATDKLDEATKIINYIRGQEQAGYRERVLPTLPGDQVWRLGDIIHSTPVPVAAPNDPYYLRYADNSYQEFREHWINRDNGDGTYGRRQVVYVGANDGMIHAFNSGFYNGLTNTLSDPVHPLGSELWAYVPYNLLPHLRWLTELNYPHVYYMDGEPLVFDANIYPANTNDGVHINGWATVLVMGMRFGGSEINIDHDDDNSGPPTPPSGPPMWYLTSLILTAGPQATGGTHPSGYELHHGPARHSGAASAPRW